MRTVPMHLLGHGGVTPGARWRTAGAGTLSFWFGGVLYAMLAPLGTLPFAFGGRTYSFEFFFALVLGLVVAVELVGGSLRIPKCSPIYLTGLFLWLFASVISHVLNGGDEATWAAVASLALKALFAYMVFVVLSNSGRLATVLWAYLGGCAVTGLFTLAFFARGGDLESLRQTSFAGPDSASFAVDVFGGLAAIGASNLTPVWLCVALHGSQRTKSLRVLLLFLILYFSVLSLLALRRDVLVEGVAGLLLLRAVFSGQQRLLLTLGALVLLCLGGLVIWKSERWQERLFVETPDEFETLSDPRLLLLLNTPTELAEAPWFGHGPESYRWLMLKYMPAAHSWIQEGGIAAHNSFSKAAVETGMVGLFGFVLMVISLGWRAYLRRSGGAPVNGLFRLTAMLLFLTIGTSMFFQDGSIANITWYFFGILLYLDRSLLREDSRSLSATARAPSNGV